MDLSATPTQEQIASFLVRSKLADPGEAITCTPLTGGVSSDIWRVDTRSGAFCLKRALPTLRVAAEWHAPVSRNAYEWAWLKFAAEQVPDNVPTPLAHDPVAGMFAMPYLDAQHFPLWKQQLLDGKVQASAARQVGAVLVKIHAASAGSPQVAARFATDVNFQALRLDPYLVSMSTRHPDLADRLLALVAQTRSHPLALVHGDVSPKNILLGPHGPVFLDAECAWYGDPAFDIAFCLNHLLLKCLVHRDLSHQYLASFEAFCEGYFPGAHWEPRQALALRAAALLPGLLLARVDGKSPVEYLVGDLAKQAFVRKTARAMLQQSLPEPGSVASAWRLALARW